MEPSYRHTKVIFTIGPATEDVDTLVKLIHAGADICRINMAHGSHEWTRQVIRTVRQASKLACREIAIMMDIKGPEIRTGDVPHAYDLLKGDKIDLYMTKEALGNHEDHHPIHAVNVNYPGLIHDVHEGNTLLIDNGLIQLKILQKQKDFIRCEVLIPGLMKSRRHINLPGVHVSLPPLTEKDKADIQVGVSEGVEFYALSFVREANDVTILRQYLSAAHSEAKIIAKIEDQSAISNLEAIVKESDGLMVARGDLGIECPFEQLPIIQRKAVNLCIKNAKPVIIATHMLESMIQSPLPTRAEVSDVANAVTEKADAIMLSAETTIGQHPIRCIEVMQNIASAMENIAEISYNKALDLPTPKTKILRSAVVLAHELNQSGIVVFTNTGFLAQMLSSLRPTKCPIFAFTEKELVCKQMNLMWGVYPILMKIDPDPEKTLENAFDILKKSNFIKKGDTIVVVTNIILGAATRDSIQLRKIE